MKIHFCHLNHLSDGRYFLSKQTNPVFVTSILFSKLLSVLIVFLNFLNDLNVFMKSASNLVVDIVFFILFVFWNLIELKVFSIPKFPIVLQLWKSIDDILVELPIDLCFYLVSRLVSPIFFATSYCYVLVVSTFD